MFCRWHNHVLKHQLDSKRSCSTQMYIIQAIKCPQFHYNDRMVMVKVHHLRTVVAVFAVVTYPDIIYHRKQHANNNCFLQKKTWTILKIAAIIKYPLILSIWPYIEFHSPFKVTHSAHTSFQLTFQAALPLLPVDLAPPPAALRLSACIRPPHGFCGHKLLGKGMIRSWIEILLKEQGSCLLNPNCSYSNHTICLTILVLSNRSFWTTTDKTESK